MGVKEKSNVPRKRGKEKSNVPRKRGTVWIEPDVNRTFKVVSLSPSGKGNKRIFGRLTKTEAEVKLEGEKVRRGKLIKHLEEVRDKLVKEHRYDPQSFDPIVK